MKLKRKTDEKGEGQGVREGEERGKGMRGEQIWMATGEGIEERWLFKERREGVGKTNGGSGEEGKNGREGR